MKNTDKQRALDKRKWIKSEKEGRDMGGAMPYCEFCDYCDKANCECGVPQTERERRSLCAKAYNRMVR